MKSESINFYSLTAYAGRFVKDPDKYISLWISQIGAISQIELCEKKDFDNTLDKGIVDLLIEKINNDELLEAEYVVDKLSLNSIIIDSGEVFAAKSLYYDFVAFLIQSGIV